MVRLRAQRRQSWWEGRGRRSKAAPWRTRFGRSRIKDPGHQGSKRHEEEPTPPETWETEQFGHYTPDTLEALQNRVANITSGQVNLSGPAVYRDSAPFSFMATTDSGSTYGHWRFVIGYATMSGWTALTTRLTA